MAKKTLIIVESPTKANTISKYFGSDCTIIASKGHIRMLPPIGMGIDVEHDYQPEYIIDNTKTDVIAKMKAALKDADELILATDEDREGESISWHLVDVLKPKIPYRRMVFHEITKTAIQKAFENGRPLDMNMVHAQEARRVLDRLYGFTISPVLWSKLSNKTLSAGRVQSPGLRLIVDKERTRLSFKKSTYWDIKANFTEGFSAKLNSVDGVRIADGKDFDSETGVLKSTSKARLLSFEDCQVIKENLKTAAFEITDISETRKNQSPAVPFKTSTLQQEGNRKLHMSAKDVMKVAQNLYENGFITYMRTDDVELSQQAVQASREAVTKLYGKEYLSDEPKNYAFRGRAIDQNAHEAIRPAGDTFITPEASGLSGRELSLYTMIFKRTLACQMKDAIKVSTSVSIKAQSENQTAVFAANGIRIEFPGFIKVYVESSDDDDENNEVLPKLVENQKLAAPALEPLSHETKEPSRYTEASLVQELEKRGIGRPSTYASIIDRILEKEYVIREKNGGPLIPTFTGFAVIQALEYFPQYMEYDFTSNMEEELDDIAKGKSGELEYLKKFYEGSDGLKSKVQEMQKTIVSKDVKKIRLPQLSEDNYITLGKFGPYVQDSDEKYHSVPKSWTPYSVTNEEVENLKNSKDEDKEKNVSPIIGTAENGQPILYCTGRYGDYWQIGDLSKTKDIRRFKVPAHLLGHEVPVSRILDYFNLPRVIGTDENGNEISANIGKFGAYIKCQDDFRNIKDVDEIFNITQTEARKIFSQPKPEKKRAATRKSVTPKKSSTKEQNTSVVKDFGDFEGQNLDIRSGRYGFYIKYGDKNVRIAAKYQHDEEACKNMSLEEATSFVKK